MRKTMPVSPVYRNSVPTLRRSGLSALALLCVTAEPSASAFAQSFDCAKASTPVERLICADPALAALDGALGAWIRKSLRAAPANRQATLTDARGWLKERDRRCPVPSGAKGQPNDGNDAKAADCLKTLYRERLAQLKSAPANASASAARTRLCEGLLHHYRQALETASKAPGHNPSDDPGPLKLLEDARGALVTIAKPVFQFADSKSETVAAWGKAQPKPVAFAADVQKELDDVGSSFQEIERLPNSDYYAATTVQGTAICYAQVFFTIRDGMARSAKAPSGWDWEEGAGCGVSRSFGTVGGASVAFEESHGYGPSLTSSLMASPWEGDHFGPACTISLTFAPRFAPHASLDLPKDMTCAGADCEDLRHAAQKLVEQVQSDFAGAEKAAVARLDPAQAKDYETMKSLAVAAAAAGGDTASEAPTEPSSILDTAPLYLPLVRGGELYLASVGHQTMGWRIYSDWSVKLERLKDGALDARATLDIGMGRGELIKATVE